MHDVLQSRWKHLREEIHSRWVDLTSADLDHINGRRDNLVVLLQRRYGFARRRAEREVERVLAEFETKLLRAS